MQGSSISLGDQIRQAMPKIVTPGKHRGTRQYEFIRLHIACGNLMFFQLIEHTGSLSGLTDCGEGKPIMLNPTDSWSANVLQEDWE